VKALTQALAASSGGVDIAREEGKSDIVSGEEAAGERRKISARYRLQHHERWGNIMAGRG